MTFSSSLLSFGLQTICVSKKTPIAKIGYKFAVQLQIIPKFVFVFFAQQSSSSSPYSKKMDKPTAKFILNEYKDYHHAYTYKIKFRFAEFTTALEASNYLYAAREEEKTLRTMLRTSLEEHLSLDELHTAFHYNEDESNDKQEQKMTSNLHSLQSPNRKVLRGLRQMFDYIETSITNLECSFQHIPPDRREDKDIDLGIKVLGWERAVIEPVFEEFRTGVEEAKFERLLAFMECDITESDDDGHGSGSETDNDGDEREVDSYDSSLDGPYPNPYRM
jgi:hypothetical protein